MSRKQQSLPLSAAVFAAALALVAAPSAVFAPAAHAQKAGKGAKKLAAPAGKPIKLADAGLSFILPAGYRAATDEERARFAPEARFFARGPRTTRFDATKYAAQNATLTTWMYSTIVVAVIPSPAPGVSDISTIPPEAEEQLKRTLEQAARRRDATFRVENTARGKVAGAGAYFLAGLSDVPGTELTFQHRTCIVLHDDKAYIFTFVSDLEAFPATVKRFEAMMASLKWDKPAKTAKAGE